MKILTNWIRSIVYQEIGAHNHLWHEPIRDRFSQLERQVEILEREVNRLERELTEKKLSTISHIYNKLLK